MSVEIHASPAVVRAIRVMALERQQRREASGDGNYGSLDAGAKEHALGLLGEWACVQVWYPGMERAWARSARLEMAQDSDVFGLLVRTRDSHTYEGWINSRDRMKQAFQFHALVTAGGVKHRLLDAEARAVQLIVWGRVWGADVIRDEYFRAANGVFPNRDSYVIPREVYRLDKERIGA